MAKRASFRERMQRNVNREERQGRQFGYIQLPRGMTMFKEEASPKTLFDILLYEVTDSNHPDKDDGAEKGDLWYRRPFKVHRNVGVNGDTEVCPTSIGKPCPLCEYRRERARAGDNKEALKPMNSSQRNLYCIVPYGLEKYKEEPHLWDISQFAFQDMLREELKANEDYLSFADLDDGYTLRVRFSEEMIGQNKFVSANRIDFEERDKKDADRLHKLEVPDLDSILNVRSYESLRAKFFEEESGEAKEGKSEEKTEERSERSERRREEPDEGDRRERRRERDDGDRGERSERRSRDDDKKDDDKKDDGDRRERRGREPDDDDKGRSRDDDKKDDKKDDDKKDRDRGRKEPATECPHDHEFGVDTDKFKDCDKCEVWEDCLTAKEKKGGKKK